jgi:hypothetical protein
MNDVRMLGMELSNTHQGSKHFIHIASRSVRHSLIIAVIFRYMNEVHMPTLSAIHLQYHTFPNSDGGLVQLNIRKKALMT